ncbi:cyclase family protein [Desulforhopalus singaporensis]|uniref:Kynurenine formamidase n=1 Tax=Desulforhopalus singaporensis TaxID=91360 RepID=A0A1H0VMI8_9BACT|nr:cyclase family protein [Desulforhopalus singaporensis]SDP79544.1 Kynurenine formamidase [Desulforhopalus singaporensis]
MKEPYGKLPLPKMTPYLLSLMKNGKVFDLGTVRSEDMPLWSGHPPFRVLPYKWHGETEDVTPPGTLYNDMVITCMHAGTHVDAFNHIGEIQGGGTIILGEGVDAEKTREWWGCNWMDGSKFHPIILRAVILDILNYKGGEDTGGQVTLPRKYGITAEDIRGCLDSQNIEIKPNVPTAFLIRTGMIKYFHNKTDNYGGNAAGPNLEAEKYMASIGGVLTGSDTVSYEQMIVGEHTVHRWMMQNGILMNEVLDLEEICKAGVTEGVYIALPLKIKGTSGSLIDPIVIT